MFFEWYLFQFEDFVPAPHEPLFASSAFALNSLQGSHTTSVEMPQVHPLPHVHVGHLQLELVHLSESCVGLSMVLSFQIALLKHKYNPPIIEQKCKIPRIMFHNAKTSASYLKM